MSLPRICLLYTGGTIAMIRDPKRGLVPPKSPTDFLGLAPELADLVDIEFVRLMNKDSTNVVPADWTRIAKEIYKRRNDGYDGFVVTHGTDTMHFSASAVSLALGLPLPFPVVFTGAQTIPEVAHGDARVNLLRACRVALENIGEVVISFGDFVFRGCRAQKKDERRFDAFESPALFPLGYITEDILITPLVHPRSPGMSPDQIRLEADFAQGVLQVSLIPGLEPSLFEGFVNDDACSGLILQSFGAGNVPNTGHHDFMPLIRSFTKSDKPVVVTSQFPAGTTLYSAYEPSKAAQRAGAIATGNMTAACAAAKLRWALAQVEGGQIAATTRVEGVARVMGEVHVDEMDSIDPQNQLVARNAMTLDAAADRPGAR